MNSTNVIIIGYLAGFVFVLTGAFLFITATADDQDTRR